MCDAAINHVQVNIGDLVESWVIVGDEHVFWLQPRVWAWCTKTYFVVGCVVFIKLWFIMAHHLEVWVIPWRLRNLVIFKLQVTRQTGAIVCAGRIPSAAESDGPRASTRKFNNEIIIFWLCVHFITAVKVESLENIVEWTLGTGSC